MNRSTRLDYTLLLLFLLVAIWQLPMGAAMLKWDAVDVYLPWKFFVVDMLAQGELPLWNPSLTGGFAQMGDTGTWYPVSWLIGFLCGQYNANALHIEFLAHLYLAALGMYALARQQIWGRSTGLMLGAIYPLSGFFIGNAQHIGWLVSAAWLPWLLLYFQRLFAGANAKDALRWAGVLFLMLSGGYPGMFIVVAYLFLGFFAIYSFQLIKNKNYKQLKNSILYLSIAVFVFLGCSAVLIAGVSDLLPHITRSGALKTSSLVTGSLPLAGLISFIFPFAASVNDASFWQSDFSMVNCYIGILPFILLIFSLLHPKFSKSGRIYFAVGLLFLMIALAQIFPLREWLSRLPAMNIFRFPALFRLFAIFFFLLAIGSAWEQLKNEKALRKQFAWLLFGLAAGFLFYSFWKFPAAFFAPTSVSDCIAVQGFVQAILLLGAASVLYFSEKKSLFLGIVMLDILLAAQFNLSATVLAPNPPAVLNQAFAQLPAAYPTPSLQTPLDAQKDRHLAQTLPVLWRSLAVFHKLPSADGFNPYVFSRAEPLVDDGLYAAFANEHPLFFLDIDNQQDSIKILSQIKIETYSPQHISLKIYSPKEAQLVFAQNYYPHWRAKLNGKDLEVQIFNEAFMSVAVPAGESSIEWDFQPRLVQFSFWISLIFWLFLIILLAKFSITTKPQAFAFFGILLLLVLILGWQFYSRRNDAFTVPSPQLAKDSLLEITDNQIDNRWDIGKLADTLATSQQPYVWFCHHCRPFFPETEWALKHYYPKHLKTEKTAKGFCWLLAKKPAKMGISNDFEQDSLAFWTWDTHSIDSSLGNHFQRIAAQGYGATYKNSWASYAPQGDTISISLKIKMEKGANALLALQAPNYWRDLTLAQYVSTKTEWTSVFWRIPISDLTLNPQDSLAFFVWNNGEKTIWVDELVIGR